MQAASHPILLRASCHLGTQTGCWKVSQWIHLHSLGGAEAPKPCSAHAPCAHGEVGPLACQAFSSLCPGLLRAGLGLRQRFQRGHSFRFVKESTRDLRQKFSSSSLEDSNKADLEIFTQSVEVGNLVIGGRTAPEKTPDGFLFPPLLNFLWKVHRVYLQTRFSQTPQSHSLF